MRNVDAIVHTATLHKPHVVTHRRQDFIDTNVTGTLNLLRKLLPRVSASSSSPARPACSDVR
jgi:nucleoside-diphosphate-sugar epimerase